MPRYDYECASCHVTEERIHPIKDCDLVFRCKCGNVQNRTINTPMIPGSFYPFNLWNIKNPDSRDGKPGPNGGVIIETKEQHRAVMARHQCVTPAVHGSKFNDHP